MQPFRHSSVPALQWIPVVDAMIRLQMSRHMVFTFVTKGQIAAQRDWRGRWELRSADVERLATSREAA